VGIEVVHDQHNLFGVRILLIAHLTEQMGKVHGCSVLRHFHPSLSRQRLEDHKQIRGAFALILVINAPGLPRRSGDGRTRFRHQLFAGFVHTDLRAPQIVRTCVNFQHVLHGADKLSVALRRDHPLFR